MSRWVYCWCVLALVPSLASPQDAPDAARSAQRAAEAAERAAEAAQKAAEAAARAADRAAPAAAAPAAAAPAAAPGAPRWTGTVGLGLISLTGNSRSTTFAATGAAERKTETWIYGAKLYGGYGQARPAAGGLDETTALNAGLLARADRRLTRRVAVYGLAGLETDHVKSVEYRASGEPGLSLVWVDWTSGDRAALLRTDLGLRYAYESRWQYYPVSANVPDARLLAPRVGASLRYNIAKELAVTEDVEVMTTVIDESRTLASSITKLTARVTTALQVGTAFTVNHDSRPAPGKVPTDTILAATIELVF